MARASRASPSQYDFHRAAVLIFVKGGRAAFRELPLRDQDGSAFEATCAQVAERGVRGIERIAHDLHPDAGSRRDFKKLMSVAPREVGDRHELALFP